MPQTHMDYQGNVIRPPSEADSIILQVTVGCTHNKCTFCGAYKDYPFSYKDNKIIESDIRFAAQHYKNKKRLFLADGDVLVIPQHRLTPLFHSINKHLPWVKRIRLYGNCKSIRSKSVPELKELKSLGLDRIYMGLESGHDDVLQDIRKGATAAQMIEAAAKVKEAGIFLSVTVLLGIAGVENSKKHAKATAEVLNKMAPKQIAVLTLMPIDGTPLHDDIKAGSFVLPDEHGLLQELRSMISGINLDKTQLQANHASNYLPINCRLQKDKARVLSSIDQALQGEVPLMPEYMRGL